MGFRWLVAAGCRSIHLWDLPGVRLSCFVNLLRIRFRLNLRIVVIGVVVGRLGGVPFCLLSKIDVR